MGLKAFRTSPRDCLLNRDPLISGPIPSALSFVMEPVIAKNQNTFAKQKREMDKKLKAEAKRLRKIKRKEGRPEDPPPVPPPGQMESPEGSQS